MWQVLKAEFEYNKGIVLTAYSLTSLTLIACLLWEVGGVYFLSSINVIIFFFCRPIMGSRSDKEKRDRLYVVLPVTLKRTSMNRILFTVLFQAGIFCIWGLLFFFDHFGHDNQAIWTMITTSAFVIMVMAFFALYHDFGYFQTGKYRIIYITTLLFFFSGLILAINSGYVSPERLSFGTNNQKTFWDTFIYILLCLSMLVFNYHLFIRRKSYLS